MSLEHWIIEELEKEDRRRREEAAHRERRLELPVEPLEELPTHQAKVVEERLAILDMSPASENTIDL